MTCLIRVSALASIRLIHAGGKLGKRLQHDSSSSPPSQPSLDMCSVNQRLQRFLLSLFPPLSHVYLSRSPPPLPCLSATHLACEGLSCPVAVAGAVDVAEWVETADADSGNGSETADAEECMPAMMQGIRSLYLSICSRTAACDHAFSFCALRSGCWKPPPLL